MKNEESHYLDIIFKGRNKEYGAYELRTGYPKRLFIALTTMVIFCVLMLFSSFVIGTPGLSETVTITDVALVDITPTAPLEKEQKKEIANKPVVKTVRFTSPVIVDSSTDVITEITSDARIGAKTIDAPIVDSVQVASQAPSVVETKKSPNTEVSIVDVEATFPGGFSSWKRFLETTLDASIPVENAAPSGTYRVTVSFLVDNGGKVSEVQALNDPGYGIADEAVKVIKRSKTWNPAISNNEKVTYRQKQVIAFQVAGDY